MKKKGNVTEWMRELSERVPGIQCPLIHGPFLKNPKLSKARVEITVVGAPDLADLDETLGRVEEELATPVDTIHGERVSG